jgi:hypothetical protein
VKIATTLTTTSSLLVQAALMEWRADRQEGWTDLDPFSPEEDTNDDHVIVVWWSFDDHVTVV